MSGMIFQKRRVAARDAEFDETTAPLAQRGWRWPEPLVTLMRATRHSLDAFVFAL